MECPWRRKPCVPGGGSHCLRHGNPVSAVVVDTGTLWRYVGFSQSNQRTKETSQATYRSYTVHEYRTCLSVNPTSPLSTNTNARLRGVRPPRGQRGFKIFDPTDNKKGRYSQSSRPNNRSETGFSILVSDIIKSGLRRIRTSILMLRYS